MVGKKGEAKKEADGKGKGGKGKGKDGKKGKKDVVSEVEETSDTELLKEESKEPEGAEEEEKEKAVEEEEEAAALEEPKKGKGKEKKGVLKAVVAKKPGRGKKVQLEPEEEEGESDAASAKKNLKGASKAAADNAKKKKGAKGTEAKAQPAEEEEEVAAATPKAQAKRSLRSTSRLFLGFKKLGLRRPKKGQFKNASRFFWGLQKQSTKKKKKKKNKAVLKSTSNLMVRFKHVGKKRKKEEAAAAPPPKPAFLLLHRAGQAAEDGASLFRRRPERKFKPRAQVLSKAAAATGWLARKLLSRRGRLTGGGRAADTAWLSRIGAKKLPFPAEDEILRHRANMRRLPAGSGPAAPGAERRSSMARRPSSRRRSQHGRPTGTPAPRYGWAQEERDAAYGRQHGYGKEEQEGPYGIRHGYTKEVPGGAYGRHLGYTKEDDGPYGRRRGYAEEEEEGPYGLQHGYEDEEEDYIHSPTAAYPPGYSFEDVVPTRYVDYPGYETEDEYGFDGGFWDENEPLEHPYGYLEPEDEDYGSPLPLYDPYSSDPEYGEEVAGPFGYRGDPYEDFGEPLGLTAGGYMADEYPEHHIQYSEGGWAPRTQSSCNPYALGLDEIAEAEEPEDWQEEDRDYPFSILSTSSLKGMRDTLSSKLSLNRKFRLFPRPQVKLFGRDRLDISLPPSPHHDEDDYDEYEPPAASPKANRGGRVAAARVCGSPLGQFLQRSLSQLQPLGRALRGMGNPWDRSALQPSYRRFGRGAERAGSVRVGGSRDPPPREPGASRPSSLRNPFVNPARSPSPPPAQQHLSSVRGERPRRSVSFGASFRREPPAVPRAPPNAAPPAPALRHSGVSGRPLAPRPSRRSSSPGVSPPGRLPLAWPRQPEPPTKAVKPLMRSSFLAPPSRPGSRRLNPSWDEAPSMELPPWQGAPPPPSPASGSPKSFIQRIGQPLAGMAPRSPPPRPPPADRGGRSPSPGRIRHVGQSLASLIVGSVASSKAPSSPPPARRPLSRSPSPPRRASRRDAGSPGSPSSNVGSPHLSSSPSARRRSPPPRGRPPGSPPVLRRSLRAPEPADSEAVAGEDGAGRYAVVTPQIQRLGSFRRASRMYKQHWSKQHVVRVREMPDAWTAEQGYPRHPAERGRQRASQRGADIGRYLGQRSASVWRGRHPWADGYLGSKQPWRSKVMPAVR